LKAFREANPHMVYLEAESSPLLAERLAMKKAVPGLIKALEECEHTHIGVEAIPSLTPRQPDRRKSFVGSDPNTPIIGSRYCLSIPELGSICLSPKT